MTDREELVRRALEAFWDTRQPILEEMAARIEADGKLIAEARGVIKNLLPIARNDRYVIQHPHYDDAAALLARLEGGEG